MTHRPAPDVPRALFEANQRNPFGNIIFFFAPGVFVHATSVLNAKPSNIENPKTKIRKP